MPLLTDERPLIAQLRVVDRQQDDTTICQVATLRGFHLSQTAAGVAAVTIDVWVTQHSSRGGVPGAELVGSPGRALQFAGDNLALVDDATGQVLAVRVGENAEQWAAVIAGFPQNTRLQGDWLLRLLLAGPVDVPRLVLYHMQRANSPELNRYA